MERSLAPFAYVVWHYSRAFRDLTSIWLNFAWFVMHYFSMRLLLRTLFAPWKRMDDVYQRGSIEALLEIFVFNTFSRVLGAFVRVCILVMGVCVLVLLWGLFVVVLAVWAFLPFCIALLLGYGVMFFVS